MIVVSNSSPLISLARIDRLNLLASFYERILVPAEVHDEVTVAGVGLPGAEEVRNAGWIEVAPLTSPADPVFESRHAKTSAQASAAPFFWPRVSRPISFFWMNGRPVASRGTQALPLRAAWECSRRAPEGALSRISAKLT